MYVECLTRSCITAQINGQKRRTSSLICTSLQSIFLPCVAYIPTVAPVYNWGGINLGINGGYGFGQSQWTDPANAVGSSGYFSANGGLVGGTVGVNFQTDAFVFGVEGDIDWQSVSGTGSNAFCSNISTTSGGVASGIGCQTQSDWLGTIRARVLFYGTAGAPLVACKPA